jgi:hypothetical protein
VFGLIEYFTVAYFTNVWNPVLNPVPIPNFSKRCYPEPGSTSFIQDGAKYHTRPELRKFFDDIKDRLAVYDLPSFSPDYNTIEKL